MLTVMCLCLIRSDAAVQSKPELVDLPLDQVTI